MKKLSYFMCMLCKNSRYQRDFIAKTQIQGFFLFFVEIFCLQYLQIGCYQKMLSQKQSTQNQCAYSFFRKFVFLIFFLIIEPSSAITTWYTFPYMRAGKILMISSMSDYGTAFTSTTITYSAAIGNGNSVFSLTLSLCNFIIYQANELSFDVNVTNINGISSTAKMILNQSSIVSLMTFQYLLIDTQSQDIDYKSINYNCVKLANLNSFYRSQNITIPVSNFVYPDADKLQYNLYLQTISISNFNGSFFHFQQIFNYNRSHYIITIKTSDYNIITRVRISMILFRTNNVNYLWQFPAFFYHFVCLDVNCFNNFIPVSNNANPNYQTQNRIYYGINSFNFTKQGQKIYNIDLNQFTNLSINFQFSNSIEFLQLDAFYIAYRICTNSTYYCQATFYCQADCTTTACKNANGWWLACLGCHFSCLTCTTYSTGSCLTCDPSTNRFLSGTSCLCKNGFVEIGTEICALCSNYMIGCTNCTDKITCQSCNQGMTVNTASNPNFCSCSNPNYFISLNGSCISIDGCLSFLNQSNIIKCTQCNISALYYEVNFTCICLAGTSQVTYSDGVTKYCKIICGNGYVSIQEQCDDGNLINGDGCSSTCAIEANFACYGQLYDKSRCFQDIQLNISYIGTLRNSISNRATMYFYITPYRSALLNIVNGSQLLNTTLFQYSSNFEVSFSQSSIFSDVGQFTVSFDYFEDLQGKNYSLYLNLNQSGYFVYPTNTSYFTINEINSKLAYNSNIDNFQSFTQIAFFVLVGLGFLIFLISLFHQKMIGVELMNTIQMYFFYLMLADSISIWLMPIQERLSYANGYNSLSSQDYFRIYQLPYQLIRSGFQKEFIKNFNFMFFILFFSIFLQLFSIIKVKFCKTELKVSKKKKSYYEQSSNDNRHQSVNVLSQNFIWGRWFLCTGLIFTNQIIMSFIIESSSTDQIIWNFQRVLSNISAFLGVLMILITFLLLFYYVIDHKNRSSHQKQHKTKIISFENTQKCYPLLFMTFQIVKILIVGLFCSYQNSVYILFGLQVLYFLIYVIYRPYRQKQQYEAIFDITNKKGRERIDMLNFESSEEKMSKNYCSSIHNIHNVFNSLGLIFYLTLLIILKNTAKSNQNYQEMIGKVMVYLCFFHILISEILALLRLIPIKLALLFDNLKNCLINCLKKDEKTLAQNNQQEEQRILKHQREKMNNNSKLSKHPIKNQVQKFKNIIKQERNNKKTTNQIKIRQEQDDVIAKKQKKLDKNLKTVQKNNTDKQNLQNKKQKGWLLKQVQDSQVYQINSKRKKDIQEQSQQKSKAQKSPKKKKNVKIGKI